jgi:hypothetical protein
VEIAATKLEAPGVPNKGLDIEKVTMFANLLR